LPRKNVTRRGWLFSLVLGCEAAVVLWECGNPALLVFAGFPSAEEGVGNSLWSLEFSALSSARHFHSRKPGGYFHP
jgi:hypothetical protein